MKTKFKGYSLIVLLFCAFGLLIYGAYSPARKAQKQRIVCIKFKEGVKNEAIKQHFHEFAALKHEIPQIVSYTAGKTLSVEAGATAEYDVMHYLTFQSEADIETYNQHISHQQFVKNNRASWEKVLVINSDIQL